MLKNSSVTFTQIAEMSPEQFNTFLESETDYLMQNLKSLYPNEKRFVFSHVEDILVLDVNQFNRFLSDFKAWQRSSHKIMSFIPKFVSRFVRFEHKMTWMDDGVSGKMRALNVSWKPKNSD